MSSLRSWISEYKIATVGTLWASTVAASLAYTRNKYPLKGGVRLIHSRMHAQALTLAVLSALAVKHYYFDSKNGNDVGSACSPEWSEINLAEGSDERWSW